MAEEKITHAELIQILELLKLAPRFSEVHLKFGDIEIDLASGVGQQRQPEQPVSSVRQASPSIVTRAVADAEPAVKNVPLQSQSPPDRTWPPDSVLVRSPMVGTFYRAPVPSAPPFVEVGQAVEADSTVCIIEVMKLMNSIAAGARGTVTHILAANAELVEHDQVIMVIKPH